MQMATVDDEFGYGSDHDDGAASRQPTSGVWWPLPGITSVARFPRGVRVAVRHNAQQLAIQLASHAPPRL